MRIRAPHYEAGQWDAVCDRCGQTFKAKRLRLEWTGLRVCSGPGTNGCFEERHPQEFVRGVREAPAPPWSRPEPAGTDVFVALQDPAGENVMDGVGLSLIVGN